MKSEHLHSPAEEQDSPQARSKRLLRALAEERSSHGHGAAAAIDERLGRSQGYMGRVLRGEIGLQVEMLFQVLDVLDTDPADFFNRAVGTRMVPERILARIERSNPEFPSALLDRAEALCGQRFTFSGSQRYSAEYGRDTQDDFLRFSDPRRAMQQAVQALTHSLERFEHEPGLETVQGLCRALGVHGSADRVRSRFAPAARALRIALTLARRHRLDHVHAQLLQRSCFLVADQGEYPLALEFSRRAGDRYLLLADTVGMARAMVDRATMHTHCGESEQAIQCFERSLQDLPEEDWIWRFATFLGLGHIYLNSGDLQRAWDFCRKAEEVHCTRQGQNWLKLLLLKGHIALAEGDLQTAREILFNVRETFRQSDNPFELALVSISLAKACLLAGDHAAVQQVAAEMTQLLRPLQRHKLASSAIYELVRAALSGQVTQDILDKVSRALKKSSSSKRSLG